MRASATRSPVESPSWLGWTFGCPARLQRTALRYFCCRRNRSGLSRVASTCPRSTRRPTSATGSVAIQPWARAETETSLAVRHDEGGRRGERPRHLPATNLHRARRSGRIGRRGLRARFEAHVAHRAQRRLRAGHLRVHRTDVLLGGCRGCCVEQPARARDRVDRQGGRRGHQRPARGGDEPRRRARFVRRGHTILHTSVSLGERHRETSRRSNVGGRIGAFNHQMLTAPGASPAMTQQLRAAACPRRLRPTAQGHCPWRVAVTPAHSVPL